MSGIVYNTWRRKRLTRQPDELITALVVIGGDNNNSSSGVNNRQNNPNHIKNNKETCEDNTSKNAAERVTHETSTRLHNAEDLTLSVN